MNAFIKNIYFLTIVIFSGLSTTFYRSQEGLFFLMFFSIFIWIYFKLGISKKIIKVSLIWFIYSFLLLLAHQLFTPLFVLRNFGFILISYVLINLFRENIFIKFEKIIYYFAIISLFFYIWQAFSYSSLISFAKILDISGDLFYNRSNYYNFIIYTVDHVHEFLFQRNSGFCWEPGPFAVFLVIAMYINLIRTNLKTKKSKIRVIVLFITILTTQSTTGIGAFSILLLAFVFFEIKSQSKYWILSILVIVFIVAFFSLPFMNEKITRLYLDGFDFDQTKIYIKETGGTYSGGRFGGFIIGFTDFKNYPLLGTGGNEELSSGVVGFGRIYIVNGIAKILSVYGLFGISLFFYLTYKSSVNISSIFNSNLKIGFFLIVTLSAFAFSLHSQVIIFALIFSSLFLKKNIFYK